MSTRHPYLSFDLGEFGWCRHCQKAHRTAAWQAKEWKCPSCGASAFDLWAWEHLRAFHPSYPEVPEEGAYYALHPDKEEEGQERE